MLSRARKSGQAVSVIVFVVLPSLAAMVIVTTSANRSNIHEMEAYLGASGVAREMVAAVNRAGYDTQWEDIVANGCRYLTDNYPESYLLNIGFRDNNVFATVNIQTRNFSTTGQGSWLVEQGINQKILDNLNIAQIAEVEACLGHVAPN